MTDSELIDALGGPANVAKRLGFDVDRGGTQRVHNWRTRGIPAKVKVDHPDLFLAQAAQSYPPGAAQGETEQGTDELAQQAT